MRDDTGLLWLPLIVAARSYGIPANRLRVRVHRGRVRSRLVHGERWVCVNDVRELEARGRPRRQEDYHDH
jgi:hypothetical protein